ncbi:uncharacterized protein LOC114247139 [Bombyx mandarina]|uniref:Uncharacterized protein LOC114247139 n=1 Tax=Bombyx mandarina TaxID=7092 RepID=A0A6J2K491_BOMMA|nr:uncharacterized protein LOC114247139 [Bombyx mandarina]
MDNDFRLSICKNCNAKCSRDFDKIVELKNSGLDVYVHGRNYLKIKESGNVKRNENVLIHNTSERNLKKNEYLRELCGYQTKCYHCKSLLQRVRSLLNEINEIKGDSVVGICKFCRKPNPQNKCKKCEYIVSEFKRNKDHEYADIETQTKTWLSKLKTLLESILKENVCCKHQMYDGSAIELQRLLKHLDDPSFIRNPQLGTFLHSALPLVSIDNISECKVLKKVISKLNTQSFIKRYQSEDSLYVMPSNTNNARCVCKYFLNKEERTSVEALFKDDEHLSSTCILEKSESKHSLDIINKSAHKENIAERTPVKSLKKKKKSNLKSKLQIEENQKKTGMDSEDIILLKMMKNREKVKNVKEKINKQPKMTQLPSFGKLPTIKVKEKQELVDLSSESSLKCGDFEPSKPKDMIQDTKIVPFSFAYEKHNPFEPIIFKANIDCSDPFTEIIPTSSPNVELKKNIDKNMKIKSDRVQNSDISATSLSGIVKYQLSNKEFIDKGWTKLPTTKIMRKINIYKMMPASLEGDWFERHREEKIMHYNSGEVLAEIDETGHGRWFYKNGNVALHHYEAKEKLADQRYVVYSSGESVNGNPVRVSILAAFDYLGNGVVYDDFGNTRLKYNQFEGIVCDSKIAPFTRWKWHDLNDPLVLESVFIDTYEGNINSSFPEFVNEDKDATREQSKNPEMLEIELENQVKEKSDKLLKKFRPFQIRMKAFKINQQFSLRVIDQTNIYLLFRVGTISLKLNLGMFLVSNEIVDTESVDVSQVVTPYDRLPPKSQSVADIQRVLFEVRKCRKADAASRVNTVGRSTQTTRQLE